MYCYKDLNDGVDFHQKCSMAFFGTKTAPLLPYTLGQMSELAKQVVERRVSVPGVQPKLSMSLVQEARDMDSRLTIVGVLGGNFIFKPPNKDFPEMPENEHATMRMAELLGIKVVPSSLIRLQSGELSYITKRIDRNRDGSKIHMIDMFQITEAFDKYKSSMEKVGKAINAYSDNTLLDILSFFELAVFSFLSGNNDMHLKNFSLIQTAFGWSLAPAYDLLNTTILLPEETEELALTMDGKKKKLKQENFIKLGNDFGLTGKQTEGVFNRFIKRKDEALSLLGSSFLTDEMKNKYQTVISERYSRLFV